MLANGHGPGRSRPLPSVTDGDLATDRIVGSAVGWWCNDPGGGRPGGVMDEAARRTTATSTGASVRVHDAWVAHHERLWRSVLAWSGDRDIASDAVAEAFAQAARRGAAIDDVGRWVWRAAFRIAGGLLADRRRHNGGPAPELVDRAAMPGEALALVDALAQLSDDDRTVVVLSLIGGWSSAEVGRLLGAGPGAVRVRLHRAKARLRTLLEEHDG